MKQSRFTDSQIMAILKQAENGLAVPDVCREYGISVPKFYKCRAKFGGMDASLIASMKELEAAAMARPSKTPTLNASTEQFATIGWRNIYLMTWNKYRNTQQTGCGSTIMKGQT